MPKVKPLAVDPRSIVLRTSIARQGYLNASECARDKGMAISTLHKRMNHPGTMTLDEFYGITKGNLTNEELAIMAGGGR